MANICNGEDRVTQLPPLSGAPDVCEALLHGGATNPLRYECDVLESDFFNWLLDSTQLQKQSVKSAYCKNYDPQHELFTPHDVHDLKHVCAIEPCNSELIKGKALRKHSLHEKTAASVLLKLFISGNE